ncbi:MAG: fibronectin type III domain-containing protein, partial [Spirochaetaceae bacterium]|nr:fibronectin type III domain-containing protein [Spirochaetaceae bacterium]
MKRQWYFTNLAALALVGLALVFTGCPDSSPDDDPPPAGLSAPADVAVTAADSQITVTWTAVAGATAYEVWFGATNDSAQAQKFGADVTETTVTITGLANGTEYFVWVRATNTAGASDFSRASGTPVALTATPEAPTTPTVTAGDRQLSVSWTAVSGATGYEVYWHTVNNTSAIPSATKQEVNSGLTATITGLANGTPYFVWVKAKNSAGASGFSSSASGTPVALTATPEAPTTPTV